MPRSATKSAISWRPSIGGVSSPYTRVTRSGVTLLELLLVLAIVSIMGLLVAPRMELVRYRMDGATRGGVTALIAAQRVAVKRQHDVVVAFDVTHDRLRIHEDADNDGEIDPGEDTRHIPLNEEVRFGLGTAPARAGGAAPVNFTEQQGGLPAIRFIRNGSASEEGVFYLTSSRAEGQTGYANDTRAIEVERATGRVTWYQFESPSWKKAF